MQLQFSEKLSKIPTHGYLQILSQMWLANMYPESCTVFFRWVIQGPHRTMATDTKSSQVNRLARSLARSTLSMFPTWFQVSNKKSHSCRMMHEMSQQLAVGMAIRLRLEGQVVTFVLQRMMTNDSFYVLTDVVRDDTYILQDTTLTSQKKLQMGCAHCMGR